MGGDEGEFSLLDLYYLLHSPPAGTKPEEMSSALNLKLVIILSSLFLPLLATSLARTNLRGKNAIQGLLSFGFLILYHQLLQFGAMMTDNTGVSPAISIWPIFMIMLLASLTLMILQDTRAGMPAERLSLAGTAVLEGIASWFEPKPRRRRRRVIHPSQRRPLSR